MSLAGSFRMARVGADDGGERRLLESSGLAWTRRLECIEGQLKMGTDIFTGPVGGCGELCKAFICLVILELSNNCKEDTTVFFL